MDLPFRRVVALDGPNVWARSPVLEVDLELGEPDAGLADRLLALTLELQTQAGSPARFGRVLPARAPGLSRLVFEYEDEGLARACLEAARADCLAALHGQPFDLDAKRQELRNLAHEIRLGPSTGAIVRAAQARGIPTRRLSAGSLVQLGWGKCQRRIWTAETDRTSVLGEVIAQDKQLTRALLQAVGVPVPEGRPVADAEDAWAAAEELGPPVVVKPQDGNQGRGVATNLTTREQVLHAYAAARQESAAVVVERFAPGSDFRLLVVGDKVVAAALREPGQVVGDGRSTVAQLVAEVNKDPRRSDGHATVLSFIKLDPIALAVLGEQGFTPESVPPAGVKVLARRNGNLSTGGTAADVTDWVHPEVAARAVEAARAVGLDVAGVDIIARDVRRPLEAQCGVIVEVNAGPGLRMHLEPSAGKPRPVGEAIVAMLFPEGQDGRLPLAAVAGGPGRPEAARLLARFLGAAGKLVGLAGPDGVFIGGRRIDAGARALLLHPRVEAAVVEAADESILQEGLSFDQCQVAVVMSGAAAEDSARVQQTLLETVAARGAAVLAAEDPRAAALAKFCPGEVIYFARDASHPLLASHLQGGGRAAFARPGAVVLARGKREEVLAIPEPEALGLLAATAAAWALGWSPDSLAKIGRG